MVLKEHSVLRKQEIESALFLSGHYPGFLSIIMSSALLGRFGASYTPHASNYVVRSAYIAHLSLSYCKVYLTSCPRLWAKARFQEAQIASLSQARKRDRKAEKLGSYKAINRFIETKFSFVIFEEIIMK